MKDKKQNGLTLKRELILTTSTLLVAELVIGSGIFKKIIPMSQTGIGEIPNVSYTQPLPQIVWWIYRPPAAIYWTYHGIHILCHLD